MSFQSRLASGPEPWRETRASQTALLAGMMQPAGQWTCRFSSRHASGGDPRHPLAPLLQVVSTPVLTACFSSLTSLDRVTRGSWSTLAKPSLCQSPSRKTGHQGRTGIFCVTPTSFSIPHCWATLTKPLASSPTGTAVGAVTSCRPEAGAPGPPSHAAPASASSASPGPRWRRAGARRCPQGLPG